MLLLLQDKYDTIDNIILNGNFAVNEWKYFAGLCGIDYANLPLHHYITRWWESKYKDAAHNLLLHIVPIFDCWNLWKNGCGSKYTSKHSNLARVKYLLIKEVNLCLSYVFPHIQGLSNRRELILLTERYVHEVKIVHMLWSKPPDLWVKLNLDGNSLHNLGIKRVVGSQGTVRVSYCLLMVLF